MTNSGTCHAIPSPIFATGYDAPALPATGHPDASLTLTLPFAVQAKYRIGY